MPSPPLIGMSVLPPDAELGIVIFIKIIKKYFMKGNSGFFSFLDLNTLVSRGRARAGPVSTSFDKVIYQACFQIELVSGLQDSYSINHNSAQTPPSLMAGVCKVFAIFFIMCPMTEMNHTK